MPEKTPEKDAKPKPGGKLDDALEKLRDKDKSAAAAQAKQISVALPTLTIDLGPDFQMKVIFLIVTIILFSFSLYLFTRTNFSTSDMFDVQRVQFNIPKLFSVMFGLFAVLYGLCLAMAAYYGSGTPKLQAAIPIVLLSLIAAVFSVFFPPFFPAFISFALSVGACAMAASFSKETGVGAAWNAARKAGYVLMILAFIFTFGKINAQKEQYTDFMLSSVVNAVPDFAESALPTAGKVALNYCADAIEKAAVTEDMVRGSISKQSLSTQLEASVGAVYTALPEATKTSVVDGLYANLGSTGVTMANNLKTSLATQLRNTDVSSQLKGSAPVIAVSDVKQLVNSTPQAKAALDLLPVLTALMIAELASLFSFVARFLAAVFAWLIKQALG